MPRRIPWQCEGCAWLTRYRECMVFTELAPEGWRRPDGSCQAHASIHRRQHVLEAVYAYKQRRERARRASA